MQSTTQVLESILVTAVEMRSEAERRRYVEQACAGDAELKRRVEALIENHFRAGTFLDSPAADLLATLDEPAVSERPDTVIGPYRLLDQIGEGGFGIVFRAEQQQPVRRQVALKVLKPGMDTCQVIARFEAERQALALMDHPNIAKVFDGGETASGRPFFVMELVRGTPITKYCDERRLTVRQRLGLFVSVCQAIQHAHQQGVIHRDIKPSNVLVAACDGKPVVKVIDFGVAKATGQRLTERTLCTGLGAVVGTLEYMSPEQAELGGQDVDPRSDIYSAGVLLYELLTGTTPLGRRRAHEAGLVEALRIIREEETPRPSARLGALEELPGVAANRGLGPKKLSCLVRGELDWIVMKALEKDPSERYGTAQELADDLGRYLQDETIRARRPSPLMRLRKWARRHQPVVVTGVVTGAALLVAVTVLTLLAAGRLREQLGETRKAQREGQRRLYEAKLAEARAKRWSRQAGQRFESLAALGEAAQLAGELGLGAKALRELRDEAIACFALTDVRLVQPEWPGFPPDSTGCPGFDAGLELYARSDSDGTISVRRVADDQELARLGSPGPGCGARGAVFSPDGRLLAAPYWRQIPDSSTDFRIWDWRRGEVVFQPSFLINAVRFSPDGRHFALAQADGTITLHDSARGKEVRRWNGGFRTPGLAFHPDGCQLAVASSHGRKVRIHDRTTGKLLRELEAGANLGGAIAWHPEGTLIAAGGSDGKVYLWDAATGRAHAVLHGHIAYAGFVAFAAGGALLVSTSDDGTTRLWDPWAGEALLRLPGQVQAVSRDDRRLLILAGTHLGHWELVCSREYRTLPRCKSSGGHDSIDDTSFSPDGRWLLGSGERGVWLWDMVAGGPGVLLPLSRTIDARFHPRRDELFTSGDAGLYRWQARAREGVLQIGPSAHCLVDSPVQRISLDQEGRHLTVAALGLGGRVFDLDRPGGLALTLPHVNANFTATSPDGKWIATGTWHGSGVKLWEARTGKEHWHGIQDERRASVTFSPDSRWLVTGTSIRFDIWDVVSGERVREVRREPSTEVGGAAFSPDGRLLAVALGLSEVQLIDTATWLPVARLIGPDTSLVTVGRSAFSPDGSQFVAHTGAGDLRVWDLRRVRAQLRDLGLDWPWPAYPPPPHAGAKPMRVEADVGGFQRHPQAREHLGRGDGHSRARRWREAVAEYARALELEPDYARATNDFAWLLATCPREEFLDAPRAVALAERAVRLEPYNGAYWNTLGVAYYRAGEWQSARSALEKSMLHQGGTSWDWFFLAMTHRRLGDPSNARLCYEQAVRWMEEHEPQNEELLRFRAEAEGLLTAKAKKN
jgi:serine/threonine protein kinase/WD40 repeat protein